MSSRKATGRRAEYATIQKSSTSAWTITHTAAVLVRTSSANVARWLFV
jgi:hypothetical protein